MSDDPICPLCFRPIPVEAKQSLHHLIPKLKGGRGGPVIRLHQICHNEIHAACSEAELARTYNTPEALRAHPRLATFIRWVAKKPPTFHSRTAGNGRRRRRK
ncbi:MAG: HNH endonuclease [Pseudomonadota bacterium]